MLHIGCHLSASKGYYAMGKTALSIGADTFQFFTRNPRGSRAKPLDLNDAQKLNELAAENHFAVLLAHAPYTINPCSANEDTRTFARETMQDDLKRLEATPHTPLRTGQPFRRHLPRRRRARIGRNLSALCALKAFQSACRWPLTNLSRALKAP